jgi:flagellar basal body-associated protein FliL
MGWLSKFFKKLLKIILIVLVVLLIIYAFVYIAATLSSSFAVGLEGFLGTLGHPAVAVSTHQLALATASLAGKLTVLAPLFGGSYLTAATWAATAAYATYSQSAAEAKLQKQAQAVARELTAEAIHTVNGYYEWLRANQFVDRPPEEQSIA